MSAGSDIIRVAANASGPGSRLLLYREIGLDIANGVMYYGKGASNDSLKAVGRISEAQPSGVLPPGYLWFRPSDSALFIHNGSGFQQAAGGGGSLDNINPSPTTGQIIGGTVRLDGRIENPVAATDVASQTDMLELINQVEGLVTTIGSIAAAFTNGVTGPSFD